jgi:hypothetical protein
LLHAGELKAIQTGGVTMYIGIGAIVLILVIVLLITMLRGRSV